MIRSQISHDHKHGVFLFHDYNIIILVYCTNNMFLVFYSSACVQMGYRRIATHILRSHLKAKNILLMQCPTFYEILDYMDNDRNHVFLNEDFIYCKYAVQIYQQISMIKEGLVSFSEADHGYVQL